MGCQLEPGGLHPLGGLHKSAYRFERRPLGREEMTADRILDDEERRASEDSDVSCLLARRASDVSSEPLDVYIIRLETLFKYTLALTHLYGALTQPHLSSQSTADILST